MRKFAQGIESNQRHHQSIAFCLRKGGKLLRIKTNTQILSYERLGAGGKPSTWVTARMTRRAPRSLMPVLRCDPHTHSKRKHESRSRTNARQALLSGIIPTKRSTFVRSPHPSCASLTPNRCPQMSKRCQEASWTLLESFEETSKIHAFFELSVSYQKSVRHKEIRSENRIAPTTP